MITNPRINDYLHQLTSLDDPLLLEMEELAKEQVIPIADRPSVQFIQTLLLCKGRVKDILEIGTAIGYTSIWLAKTLEDVHIHTIERNEKRFRLAQEFIQRAGLTERITLHHADATEYAPHIENRFDVLFIDAAKGQYPHFFGSYAPKVRQDGIILTDNVFFHGEVVEEKRIENRRRRALVAKIINYNEWLSNHPDYDTSFIPIGDGIALSVKKDKG